MFIHNNISSSLVETRTFLSTDDFKSTPIGSECHDMLNNLKMFVLFSYSHPIYSTLAGCFKIMQSPMSSSSSTMAARHCIIIVMFAFIFFFNEVSGHCLERHKSLLLNFKHSLVIDEVYMRYFEKPSKLANWNSSTDCCLWPGVTCSGAYVTGLDLSDEGIVGGFNDSSSLFDLTGLSSLNLAKMGQKTVIPSGIERLVNLMNLNISTSGFSGQIPIQISNLTRLVSLDFSYCDSLKVENPNLRMLVGNLSNLIELRLDSIDLSSQSREWCQALSSSTPHLQVLNLYRCGLSGSIQCLNHDFNLPGLQFLDLSSNKLHGSIPKSICNMTELFILDLSNNSLDGTLPQCWLPNLNVLSLSSNKLHGSIPKSICNMTSLRLLDLSNNSLDGTLPQCWPPALWVVNLSKNNINGIIPDTLLLLLQILDLSQNSFHGQIPKSLEGCTNLEVLDLGYNQLHGMFPCWISNLDQLIVLVLRSNSLYGSIQCLNHDFNLSRLQIIDIASNNFGGNLPSQCLLRWNAMMVEKRPTNQTGDLQYLQLFTVTVLVTVKGLKLVLTKISTIYTLVDFSDNKFEGEITHEFGKLTFLYALNLSHNYLIGQIPPSFGNLYGVESLDLSKNELSGKIPGQLASLNALSFLNLSFNHLEGMIPKGSQFNTFTDASFKENKGLCGQPLNVSCGSKGVSSLPNPPYEAEDELGDGFKFRDIFIATEIGYVLGLGLVIMPLLFWSTWRQRYYKYIDKVLNGIC